MITRRKFFVSLSSVPLAIGLPSLSLAASQADINSELAGLPITEEIRALESRLHALQGGFDYGIHNDLRHHYLPISEKQSRRHSDIILANWVMDGYILNTLSDWHFTDHHGAPDIGSGVAVLLTNVERYGYFKHLAAACLIKAGDALRQIHQESAAMKLYHKALETASGGFTVSETLKPYQYVAQSRLTFPKLT